MRSVVELQGAIAGGFAADAPNNCWLGLEQVVGRLERHDQTGGGECVWFAVPAAVARPDLHGGGIAEIGRVLWTVIVWGLGHLPN